MKATHRLRTNYGEECEVYPYCGAWRDPKRETLYGSNIIESVTLLPTTTEPETFDCETAMRLTADGVRVQIKGENLWLPIEISGGFIFIENRIYRRKPSPPPEPKVNEYWVNYYPVTGISSPLGDTYLSKKECEEEAQIDAKARLKITVTEGKDLPVVEVIPV